MTLSTHLERVAGLDELQFEDIELHGYQHHPFIRFKVAV